MDSVTLKAYGKINLSLDVLRRRADGYHDVAMVMQTVDIYDVLTIKKSDDNKVSLATDLQGLTCGEDNLVCRAINMLREEFEISRGVEAYLEKNIPMAAGMAGGSADCAAALKGMNMLFELGLSDEELMKRGVRLGADVPYCIMGGTALSEGIGEVLTPLKSLEGECVVVATPDINVSTPWVYNNLVLNENTIHPNTKLMLEAVKTNNIKLLAENMYNVLESVTAKEYKEIREIEDIMLSKGAYNSIMSGSGPTVFGIFPNEESALEAYNYINDNTKCRSCYITKFTAC